MDKRNCITTDEQKALNEMIRDDIEFVTGKSKFDYFLAFAPHGEKEVSLNMLTNLPHNILKKMIKFVKQTIDEIDEKDANITKVDEEHAFILKKI